MSTTFLFSKVCWQCPAMFCLYTSSKLSCPLFEFSHKMKVMGLTTGYLLKSFLLYCALFLFSDTGISLQIQMYQLYSEFFVFVFSALFSFLLPISFGRKAASTVIGFIYFVVQPLFYLHGDDSFRNRLMNQGIWQALKMELF